MVERSDVIWDLNDIKAGLDVFCGDQRQQFANHRFGRDCNGYLLKLVKEQAQNYKDTEDDNIKKQIRKNIVHQVTDGGGRFLRIMTATEIEQLNPKITKQQTKKAKDSFGNIFCKQSDEKKIDRKINNSLCKQGERLGTVISDSSDAKAAVGAAGAAASKAKSARKKAAKEKRAAALRAKITKKKDDDNTGNTHAAGSSKKDTPIPRSIQKETYDDDDDGDDDRSIDHGGNFGGDDDSNNHDNDGQKGGLEERKEEIENEDDEMDDVVPKIVNVNTGLEEELRLDGIREMIENDKEEGELLQLQLETIKGELIRAKNDLEETKSELNSQFDDDGRDENEKAVLVAAYNCELLAIKQHIYQNLAEIYQNHCKQIEEQANLLETNKEMKRLQEKIDEQRKETQRQIEQMDEQTKKEDEMLRQRIADSQKMKNIHLEAEKERKMAEVRYANSLLALEEAKLKLDANETGKTKTNSRR